MRAFLGDTMFSTRTLLVALSGWVLLACSCLGQTAESRSGTLSNERKQVLAAYHSRAASYSDFKRAWKFVIGPPPKWREIPWVPGLWQGIEASQAKNKPIFLWAMNGDPLGCV